MNDVEDLPTRLTRIEEVSLTLSAKIFIMYCIAM